MPTYRTVAEFTKYALNDIVRVRAVKTSEAFTRWVVIRISGDYYVLSREKDHKRTCKHSNEIEKVA